MAFLRRFFGGGGGQEKSAWDTERDELVAERTAIEADRDTWPNLAGDQRQSDVLVGKFQVAKYRKLAKAFNAARSADIPALPSEPDAAGAQEQIYQALKDAPLNSAFDAALRAAKVKNNVVWDLGENPLALLESLRVRMTHWRALQRLSAINDEIAEGDKKQAESVKEATQQEKERLEAEEKANQEEAARKAREAEDARRKESEARARAVREAEELRRAQEEETKRQREAEETRAQVERAQQQQARAGAVDTSQEEHIRDLEAENERLMAENKRMQEEIEDGIQRLTAAKENMDARLGTARRAQAAEVAAKTELAQVRAEADALRKTQSAELARRDTLVQQLEARVRDQEAQLTQITGTRPDDERRREQLERDNAELAQRAERLRAESEELAARQVQESAATTLRLETAERSVREAAAEKERVQRDLDDATRRARELDEALQRERAQLAAGTTALDTKSQELDNLRRTHAATETELEQIRLRALNLEQLLQQRTQEVAEAQRAKQAVQKTLEAEEADVIRLLDEIEQLRREKKLAEDAVQAARQEGERVRDVEQVVDKEIVALDHTIAARAAARDAERLAALTRPKAYLVARTTYIQALRLPPNIKLAKKVHLVFGVVGDGTAKVYTTDAATIRTVGGDSRAVAVYWDARPMPITFEIGEHDKKTRRGQAPEVTLPAVGIAIGLIKGEAIQHRFPQLDAAVIHGDLSVLDELGDDINDADRGHLVLYFFPATEFAKTRRVRRLLFYRGAPLTDVSLMPDVPVGPGDAATVDDDDESGSEAGSDEDVGNL